ncbi:hypothetical protein LTR85_009527 [Meristemomyces frigidus]|nr:hypothetical protein LTR85_009527 [Meristemomyces frigidus]
MVFLERSLSMHQNGVQARVYSTESEAKKEEFTPPIESPLYTDDPTVRYVEALDGETFGVMFDIEKDVARGATDATAVEVFLKVDGGLVSKRIVIPFSKHIAVRSSISNFSAMKHGQWQRYGLAFGKMSLDEDLVLSLLPVAIVSLAVLKAISFDDECRLERQAGETVYASDTVDLTQSSQSMKTLGMGKGHGKNLAITDSFMTRKDPLEQTEGAVQTTPRKRSAESVEVLDMTDGDSPPKRLKSVHVDPVPFPLGHIQPAERSPVAVRPADQSLEKRRLELQLEEIKIKEERVRIERLMLELEGNDGA